MELEELKANWDALDKRLEESEVVNLRLVKEIITQKTRSANERIMGNNIYHLVVNLLVMCVVFPYIYMSTPISTASFVIVEIALALGLIPIISKLLLLSKFDVEGKKSKELSTLVLKYKVLCQDGTTWTIILVCLTMAAFYISELGFNQEAGYVLGNRIWLVVVLTLLTFAMGFIIGYFQRKRHTMQMQEIEKGLVELKEFEH